MNSGNEVTSLVKIVAVLCVISILISGGSLLYVSSMSKNISSSVSEDISSLSSELDTISDKLSDVLQTLGEMPVPSPLEEVKRTLTNAYGTHVGKPDIYLGGGSATSIISYNCYDRLIGFDDSTPPKIIQSGLAESWEISDDGLTYTFNLRKGIKFHSGNEVTAEDIKYTMDRLMTMKISDSYLFEGLIDVGDVEVVDKHTVNFNLNIVFAPFIELLNSLHIYDSTLMEEHTKTEGSYGEFGDYGSDWLMEGNDAGSGPYRIAIFRPDELVRLTRFEDYYKGWVENQFYVIENLLIKEDATYKLLVSQGVITLTDQSRSPTFYQDIEKLPDFQLLVQPEVSPWSAWFNVKSPPLDDVHLRRALAYCLDADTLITDVMLREPDVTSFVLHGPLPSSFPMSIDDELPVYSTHNLDAAKEELSQSDYNGEEIVFYYLTIEEWRLFGLLLQSNADEIGVNIKLESLPWATYLELVTNWETTPPISVSRRKAAYLDPDALLYSTYHTCEEGYNTYARNPAHYSNPILDELLESGRITTNADERAEIYREVQEIIHSDVPCIFGVNRNAVHAADRHIKVNLNGAPDRIFCFWFWSYEPD